MATDALNAHVQSEVANALTVLRTELQQRLQEVATVTNAHEARLIALDSVRNMVSFMQAGASMSSLQWNRCVRR